MTRSAKPSEATTLVDVAFSVIVMFDFQLERWLDIAMPAPGLHFKNIRFFVSTDSHILRSFCPVKQKGGSTQIHDLRVERRLGYELDGQPALLMWQRSMRSGLDIKRQGCTLNACSDLFSLRSLALTVARRHGYSPTPKTNATLDEANFPRNCKCHCVV